MMCQLLRKEKTSLASRVDEDIYVHKSKRMTRLLYITLGYPRPVAA